MISLLKYSAKSKQSRLVGVQIWPVPMAAAVLRLVKVVMIVSNFLVRVGFVGAGRCPWRLGSSVPISMDPAESILHFLCKQWRRTEKIRGRANSKAYKIAAKIIRIYNILISQ
jgi:hypothetical protein